jgi:protein-S-isoprenylcysteine O-methyltransferase Ste14
VIKSESITTDYKKWLGSLIMLSFGIFAFLRWKTSGELFFMLLFFRDTIAAFFLSRRERAEANGSKGIAIVAYLSSGLPLIYLSAPFGLETRLISLSADLFAIIGFLIVTWATIDLGTKLGVSPAKRGNKCTKGLYGFLGHPMYLGYVIAQLGWVFINQWNLIIFVASIALFVVRARAENLILRVDER